ncbi:hypothetical protein M407DRAFT_232359 [Tulasnella calospora MUT 4182]|uniref:Cytochrome P450 n=1 Tax=Tulasnella calospora MUT 4182 TaxID=1051891 RepID=A0A0C3L1T6_9AGAM|nr:hypothetical protein M407DRAFT_232359 [Tulasnella calospora MUT 4182]
MSLRTPASLPPAYLAVGGVALLALCLFVKYRASRQHLRHPPGPRPLPLIGNILDLPKSQFALTWTKFGEQYGPLTWLTIPGRNFLVINSFEAAKEILEKRGSNYINRPRFVMMGELVGFQELTPLNQYDALWRTQRTLLKHALSAEVIEKDYAAILENSAQRYVERLLEQPENFAANLKRSLQENVIDLTYGKREDTKGRDYVQLNGKVMDIGNETMQGYLVDLLPALLYLPSWLPGMNFKKKAARWRDEIDNVRRTTFESSKESVLSGDPNLKSSYVVNCLQALYRKHDSIRTHQVEEQERAICHSGFSFFMAGTDTTQMTTRAFLLAMLLHPSIQEKVHAEMDKVVGSGRPPTLGDLKDMPYLNAVVLETLRWNPVAADGVPHAPLKDDVYNGYFIPKDTTVVVNSWGISRNPRHYSNPSNFDPERYLKPVPELDPREFTFGLGRRACPGVELGYRIVWMMAATVLWAFQLKREDGDNTPLNTDSERFHIWMLW